MALRPLAIHPPMDNLQVNEEGRQVLLMQQPAQQPADAQHILLPSAQVQHLPNRQAPTTQQQIQAGGLCFGVTQTNGMYFHPNQTITQAMLPVNAAPPRYVSPMYTQVQIGNGNYAPLEMNPTTALYARPNYVMHPSSFIPRNDSMLAPVRGSISGTPHLDPAHCGVMLHGRSNLGMPRPASRTMDSFCVQDKMSTGLFDSNILGPTNVLLGTHGTFQDLLRSASTKTTVESILTEGMTMLPEKNPSGYHPSSTYQISNEGATDDFGKDAVHLTPDSPSRLVVDDSGYASSESSLYDVDSDDEDDALGFQDEENIESHNLAASSECPVNNICNASEQVPSTINQGDANPVEDCPCVNGNPFMHVMTEVTEDTTQTVGWKKRNRTPKGMKRPDCRVPKGMGPIEIALRNAPYKKTKHIFEPVLGITFDSENEDYDFYNMYSWEVGFGIKKDSIAGNERLPDYAPVSVPLFGKW